MSYLARKENESEEKYRARQHKDNVLTRRALKPRQAPKGHYVGVLPTFAKRLDKDGKIVLPVVWFQNSRGVPFRRGPKHPKVQAAVV